MVQLPTSSCEKLLLGMWAFIFLFSWGMTRITLFLAVLFFLGSATSANCQKSRDWITLGDQSAENSDWMAALTCYQKAFVLDSAEFDYAVKYAEALRMTRDYEKAEYYYAKVYGKDRGKILKNGQFWLAMMQKQNGHYTEALRNFKKYSKKVKRDSEGYEYRKCIQEIEACTWSINERRNDSEVQITKVDEPISTPASDLGSWLLEDSTFIYSSASKKGKDIPIRIWNSSADSIYSKPDQIKAGYLPQQANVCFEDDGKTVYFCDCGTDNRCSIMRGEWKDGKIEGAEKLINVNKSEYTSTMPHWAMVGGREVLFFVTDRAGGQGKLDIWWSELQGGQPQPQGRGSSGCGPSRCSSGCRRSGPSCGARCRPGRCRQEAEDQAPIRALRPHRRCARQLRGKVELRGTQAAAG